MSLLNRAKSLLGDSNSRELKRLQPIVREVAAWEDEFAALTDAGLRDKTAEFRARLEDGAALDDILPEAFAVVREAGRRWLEMRHYDVQIVGGVVLHQGKIAEMRTGEGKTLVATLPIYLNALEGDGVHLVTVNDYLAKRDARWMAAVYHGLGLSVGVLQHRASFEYDPAYDPSAVPEGEEVDAEERVRRAGLGDLRHLRPCSRARAYQCDITYGTNNEFGFDFLRDNMATTLEARVQRPLAYAIVDEVDNILIDEARTPLIISGQASEPLDTYHTFARIVRTLDEGEHFTTDPKSRTVALTEPGIEKVERSLGIDNLFEGEDARLTRFLEAALRAEFMYRRDQEYMVRGGKVVIVDEFTGRVMEGRRYSEGLHQAIEAKEGVPVERETVTLATITYQNYFRMYGKLAGMTGTAETEAEELNKIYSLEVVVIPTNVPMRRDDQADLIFRNETAKFRAAVDEIAGARDGGQPVLVGTASVESSERLSGMLTRRGVAHNVLNAKNHEREAGIVAEAGQAGAVTIATNMAGRGTDIKLGPGVQEAGGLLVLGTERHESRRIDNQLRGRSGRQGDPGTSRFFVSFEDTIMRRFPSERVTGMMGKLGWDDDMPMESGMVGWAIEQTQQKVEAHHFDIRKHLVEYDDVINRQREVIYSERDKVLSDDDIHAIVRAMIEDEARAQVEAFSGGGSLAAGDADAFWAELGGVIPLDGFDTEAVSGASNDAVIEALGAHALGLYEAKRAELGDAVLEEAERQIVLRIIDRAWVAHLTEMDSFRQGVGLQAYGQQDPLVTYKREAFDMFDQLTATIRREVTRAVLRVRPAPAAPAAADNGKRPSAGRPPRRRALRGAAAPSGAAERMGVSGVREISGEGAAAEAGPEPSRGGGTATVAKTGRNAPCPCGSGKKYKRCHGAVR
jgi:preprotein translocase subunit SecA